MFTNFKKKEKHLEFILNFTTFYVVFKDLTINRLNTMINLYVYTVDAFYLLLTNWLQEQFESLVYIKSEAL